MGQQEEDAEENVVILEGQVLRREQGLIYFDKLVYMPEDQGPIRVAIGDTVELHSDAEYPYICLVKDLYFNEESLQYCILGYWWWRKTDMPGEMAGKPATSERLGPIVDQLLPHELMLSPIADENSICVLLHTSTVTVVPEGSAAAKALAGKPRQYVFSRVYDNSKEKFKKIRSLPDAIDHFRKADPPFAAVLEEYAKKQAASRREATFTPTPSTRALSPSPSPKGVPVLCSVPGCAKTYTVYKWYTRHMGEIHPKTGPMSEADFRARLCQGAGAGAGDDSSDSDDNEPLSSLPSRAASASDVVGQPSPQTKRANSVDTEEDGPALKKSVLYPELNRKYARGVLPKDVLYFDNEPTDTVQILNIPAEATNEELRAMLRKYGEVNALLRDQAGSDTAIVQFEHHAMAAAFYRADGLAVRGQPVRVQVFAALPLQRRGGVDASRLSKEYRRAQARDAPEKRRGEQSADEDYRPGDDRSAMSSTEESASSDSDDEPIVSSRPSSPRTRYPRKSSRELPQKFALSSDESDDNEPIVRSRPPSRADDQPLASARPPAASDVASVTRKPSLPRARPPVMPAAAPAPASSGSGGTGKLPSHEEVMMSQLTRKELIKLYRLHGEDGIRKIPAGVFVRMRVQLRAADPGANTAPYLCGQVVDVVEIPERPYTGPWNAPTCLYFNCVFMPDAEPIPFVINSLSGSPISVNEHRLWANDYQKEWAATNCNMDEVKSYIEELEASRE